MDEVEVAGGRGSFFIRHLVFQNCSNTCAELLFGTPSSRSLLFYDDRQFQKMDTAVVHSLEAKIGLWGVINKKYAKLKNKEPIVFFYIGLCQVFLMDRTHAHYMLLKIRGKIKPALR